MTRVTMGSRATPATRSAVRADIQGLRAIAVLMVVAFHAGLPLPGGFIGVDVFFVISGFVITAMMLRQRSARGNVRLREFYARRFRRLVPALALVVTFTVLASAALLSPFGPQQVLGTTAVAAMLSLANAAIAFTTGGYFDAPAKANPLLNTWSLSVEEQFYAVMPAVFLACWWFMRSRRARIDLIVITTLALASFAVCLAAASGWSPPAGGALVSFYSPLPRVWEFAAGALLALTASRFTSLPAAARALIAWVGMALILTGGLVIDELTPFPSAWTLLPVVGAAAVIAAGIHAPAPGMSWLEARPMRWTGDASYSIYLWHWPLVVFAGLLAGPGPWVAVAALLSFLPAAASYRWVEQPLRRSTWGGRRRAATAGVLLVAVPVSLGLGLRAAADARWWSPRIEAVDATIAERGSVEWARCTTDTTIGARNTLDPDACVTGADRPGAPVVLIGDSNAAMYAGAIAQVATELNRPAVFRFAALCPPAAVIRASDWGSSADRECTRLASETADRALDAAAKVNAAPPTVVLGLTGGYWTDRDVRIGTREQEPSSGLQARSAAMRDGLTETIEALERAGASVVILSPIVTFDDPARPVLPDRCSTLGLMRGTCPQELPRASAIEGQEQARTDVRAVAATTGAAHVDVARIQCPEDACPTRINGIPVLNDPSHLSAAFAQSLVPMLVATLGTPAG